MRLLNIRHVKRAPLESNTRKGSRVRESIAGRAKGIRQRIRRNRVLVVALLSVGGLVALLTGISMGQGNWFPALGFFDDGPGRPKARFGAATTFIEDQQQMLVFGGFVGSTSVSAGGVDAGGVTGPPIVNDDHTYLFRGRWQGRDPVSRPSPRGFAAMAYDGARKNVVLFGGAPYNTNNVSGETWIWNNQDWILQNPHEPRPDPRQNAVMVYDAHRKVVMMYGGRDKKGIPMGDTWIWNGSAWKIMPPAGAPSPRHSAAIAYDFCRAEAVMFGGVGAPVNSTVSQPFETWTWNGSKWTQQSPKLSPPPRIGAGMAYSRRSGNVLLYGGLDTREAGVPTAATDDDVWRWLPGGYPETGDQLAPTWERMNSDVTSAGDNVLGPVALEIIYARHSPPPRGYASFIGGWDPDYFGSTFNLYGGTPSAGANGVQVAYGDHFLFGDQNVLGKDTEKPLPGGGGTPISGKDTPLTRRCAHPVPIPDDAAGQIAVPEEPKVETREGMREIGQLPVLTGTDWPAVNRSTHLGFGQNRTSNPNYTPPPDCPNRSIGGSSGSAENGSNTYLFTDQKRNRVYQFFFCDPDRGSGGKDFSQNFPQVQNLLIAAYDGTTLKQIGSVILRNVSGPGFGEAFFSHGLFHDADQGRFLIRQVADWTWKLLVLQQDLIEKSVDPVVDKINLSKMPVSSDTSGGRSFFIDPKTGRYKMLYAVAGSNPAAIVTQNSNPTSTPPKLIQLDLRDDREDWRVDVPDCGMPGPGSGLGWATMRSGNRVYTLCHAPPNALARVSITENADGSETSGAPEYFRGPIGLRTAWGDPEKERFLLHSETGVNGTNAVWVFDGRASRWVGRIGVGSGYSKIWGFDKETGRLYVHKPDVFVGKDQGGVKLIDTRLTPVSQPLNFPQFAFPVPSGSLLASLPSGPGIPRRILTRQAGAEMSKYPNWETVKFQNEMHYRVLADEVPIPNPSDLSELDLLTIPVPEVPGKTEVSFDAEGSGYGIRLRSVGGIWTTLRPFQQAYSGIFLPEQAEVGVHNLAGHLIPACAFPDRELMAGWVPQARLSDLDALARSSGLEVDSNSKTDLTGPFSRCNPTANAADFPASIKVVFDVLWPLWQMVQSEGNKLASQGTAAETGKDADGKCGELKQPTPTGEVVISDCTETPAGTILRGKDAQGNPIVRYQSTTSSWDSHFKEVECVGDALKTYQANVGNIYGSANCVQTKGKVEATARGSATGAGPTSALTSSAGFSVAEGYSTVEVTREPNGRGVVVTSTAVAKGIQLPGVSFGAGNLASLSIDRVETKAVAWSNGRPSDPFENPRATFTRTICGVHTPDGSIPGCLTSDQQQTMVNNWNARWGINSKMYLPKPDPDFYQGSPGGYIAGVIKPVADEIEDQLFAKDFQREVPGLVIEFYKDSVNQGNARQTLQLAAVRAVAGLGVQCNPDLVYSPQAYDCVALPDDLLEEEFFEEDEEEFFEDEEEELDGEWIPAEALEIPGESIGKKIGRFIQNLPVIRQLPIRQMGEALLASSVWVLLGLPLLFAWRRLFLNNMEVRS